MTGAIADVLKSERALEQAKQQSTGATQKQTDAQNRLAEARKSSTRDIANEIKLERELAAARAESARADVMRRRAQRDHNNTQRVALDIPDIDVGGMTGALSGLGSAAGKAAGPAGVALLAGGLVELGGIAAVTVQSLWALPAVITAVGAGVATAKLGFSGFGDALSAADPIDFATALQALSPSAQQAAVALTALKDGPVAELKAATQEALFSGVGDQLTGLGNTYLPVVQNMTVGIADAFNGAFSGLSSTLQQPAMVDTISGIADDVAIAFQNAAPAVGSFVDAFLQITSVGADFLPDLATGAADLAAEFAGFIGEARQSGELRQWLQDGMDALGEIGSIAKSSGEMFMEFARIGKEDLPVIADAFRDIADNISPIVDTLQAVQNLLQIVWDPLGGVKDLAEQFGIINPSSSDRSPGGVGPDGTYSYSGSFGTPQSAGRPTTGRIGGVGGGAFAGAQNFMTTGWEDPRLPITGPPKGSGASGYGSSAKNAEGLVPNNAALKAAFEAVFPGVQVSPDVGRQDSFGEHASGEALDIGIGSSPAELSQMHKWVLANAEAFGLEYTLFRQKSWSPDGSVRPMPDRGSDTANHMDHIHTNVRDGAAASGQYMPVGAQEYRPGDFKYGGTTPVSIESFASSAASQMQASFTNTIDEDFGISKGLPGIFENLFKTVANLAMAPVIGALMGITAVAGTAGPGTGLLGALAPKTNAFGWQIPGYGQATTSGFSPSYPTYGGSSAVAGGLPGLGSLGPNGAPLGAAASGVGAGPLPGPGFTPGASPFGPLSTGTAETATRGIEHGRGVPASDGIGIGGGIVGAAAGAGGSMLGPMGAGAQVGLDLINRSIGLGGQLAGNAVQGLMETFLPVESELADPSRGWFGRILGAVASVRPAADNVAGQLTSQDKAFASAAKGKNPMKESTGNSSVTNNISVNQIGKTNHETGSEVAYYASRASGMNQ